MKLRNLIIITLSLIIFSTIFYGCRDLDNSKAAWLEMPDKTNPNLKYFGYYHFDDYVDEIAALNNSNICKTDAENIEEIAYLYNKGFNIFIMIRHIFFDGDILYSNYLEKWQTAKTELAPYMDKIIGFYMDEPYWNGREEFAFQTACQTVLADYPAKRMMAVLAYASIALAPEHYFDYCTDLGFDYYEAWNKESVIHKINSLIEKRATNNQDIWIIPKAFYAPLGTELRWQENLDLAPGEDIINWIKGSYEIAVSNERIAGIFVYPYYDDEFISLKNFFDEDSEYYNKALKDIYIQIGKEVIK